jgi:hypothetical protein
MLDHLKSVLANEPVSVKKSMSRKHRCVVPISNFTKNSKLLKVTKNKVHKIICGGLIVNIFIFYIVVVFSKLVKSWCSFM